MRNSMPLILVVAMALAGGACSRKGGESQQTAEGETDAMGHAHRRVSLHGCVQAAPGFNQYVLHRVTFASDQSTTDEIAAATTIIPPGSWVRLKAEKADLKSYLGQQVAVTGVIDDTGANTIGTSSKRSQPTDRAMPPSSVPPPAADANGAPPEVAVEQISTLMPQCEAERETGTR
jgi:hypothetical protein